MNLLPLSDHLVANSDLVFGESLFVFQAPPKDECVMLLSSKINGGIDSEIPGRSRTEVQLIVRGHDYVKAMVRAEELLKILTIEGPRDMGHDTIIQFLRPLHRPFAYPRSDADTLECSVNFICLYDYAST